MYDLTKVPDVYDMIRYDVLHNSHLNLEGMNELFHLSMAFADCVVPQEYGIHETDKRTIGSKLCGPLLQKIRYDLMVVQSNENDMHYLLDHSHAEDLAINSLNRSELFFYFIWFIFNSLITFIFSDASARDCISLLNRIYTLY